MPENKRNGRTALGADLLALELSIQIQVHESFVSLQSDPEFLCPGGPDTIVRQVQVLQAAIVLQRSGETHTACLLDPI